ncbi:hypothetical protein V8E51_013700 [Hyaloscypha variabilis]|uniref:Uncharacterized protein n=1 Tax=Hyaloscypha variabilis (strain UAMH 11265 / GT02V1 / F) TaxID=1149755 RepID=A0A2J6QTK4_HYAVF|nr:hypothetical protein L207DRAFT_642340 [Hyaloscypha variabilis F]
MHLPTFLTLLPFLAFSTAKPHPFVTRQTTTTSATIYAYGTNISGLPLVYGLSDGLAYIADTSSFPSTLSAITWDITTDTSTAWNATTSNSTSVGSFFITPGSSLGAVGFTSANTTSAVTTTGFSLFGEQVVFVNGSTYESQFWASSTDTDGVWALYWNSDGIEEGSSVPVVLKTIGPSGTTSS